MLPWTVVRRFLAGFVGGALRSVPLARVSVLLVPVVVGRAAVELYAHGGSAPLLLLVLLVAALFVCPPVDAAVRRAREYAADRHVACLGMGRDLAGALTALQVTPAGGRSWVARLIADHPPVERRLARLDARSLAHGPASFVT
jgi:Zn-dependent protease with chaperone function